MVSSIQAKSSNQAVSLESSAFNAIIKPHLEKYLCASDQPSTLSDLDMKERGAVWIRSAMNDLANSEESTISFNSPISQITAKLFSLPAEKTGKDAESILDYQRGRKNPFTFLPLDYFETGDDQQQFFKATVSLNPDGGDPLEVIEYFSPYIGPLSPNEIPPPIQLKKAGASRLSQGLKIIAEIVQKILLSPRHLKTLKNSLAELAFCWSLISPCKTKKINQAWCSLLQKCLTGYHDFSLEAADNFETMAINHPHFPDFLTSYEDAVQLTNSQDILIGLPGT